MVKAVIVNIFIFVLSGRDGGRFLVDRKGAAAAAAKTTVNDTTERTIAG